MSVINNSRYYFTSNISDLLSQISNVSELQYLALILDDTHDNKLVAELPLLLTTESFNNLINYYGGKTVYIPTKDEIYNNIVGLMSYYLYDIKGVSWNNTLKQLGVPKTSKNKRMMNAKYYQVVDHLKDLKVPKVLDSQVLDDNHNRYRDDSVNKVVTTGDKVLSKSEYDLSVSTFIESALNDNIISEEIADKLRGYLDE